MVKETGIHHYHDIGRPQTNEKNDLQYRINYYQDKDAIVRRRPRMTIYG